MAKDNKYCNEYLLSILNIVDDYCFMMNNVKSKFVKMKSYNDCVNFINNEADRFIENGYDSTKVNNVRDKQLLNVKYNAKYIGII